MANQPIQNNQPPGPGFGDLPPEVRQQIWGMIPMAPGRRRIFEAVFMVDEEDGTLFQFLVGTGSGQRVPHVMPVSYEASVVARRHWTFVPSASQLANSQPEQANTSWRWFDPENDLVQIGFPGGGSRVAHLIPPNRRLRERRFQHPQILGEDWFLDFIGRFRPKHLVFPNELEARDRTSFAAFLSLLKDPDTFSEYAPFDSTSVVVYEQYNIDPTGRHLYPFKIEEYIHIFGM